MRLERDALGELAVPDGAYYGIQTVRTAGNYCVSDRTYGDYPEVMHAVAEVKKACAITNAQIGALEARKARAIEQACDELIAGRFDDQFPVNVWRSQGTGVNMNVNEVLANRANEILTGRKGYDEIHPNTHVNMCQSSNDVFPTVEAIVLRRRIPRVCASLEELERSLSAKAFQYKETVRLGRTGLQDAVPLTYGQVFGGWQSEIQRNRFSLQEAGGLFEEVVLGATVLGTGMGQLPGYAERIYGNLSEVVGFQVRPARMLQGEAVPDSALFDGMRNTDHHHILMQRLCAATSAMGRIAADLLLFGSGPRAGLGELVLPELDPALRGYVGTSCVWVPQFVLDVMHEAEQAEQMALLAANEGQLDHGSINSGGIICVLDALSEVEAAAQVFARKCIVGIQVNEERCRRNAELSTSLATMVSALYGYPTGVKIAKMSLAQGISCKEAALREKLLPEEVAEELFNVKKLTDRRAMVEMFRKYGTLRRIS